VPLLDIMINRDFRFGSIFLNKAVPVITSCDTAYYRNTGIPPNTSWALQFWFQFLVPHQLFSAVHHFNTQHLLNDRFTMCGKLLPSLQLAMARKWISNMASQYFSVQSTMESQRSPKELILEVLIRYWFLLWKEMIHVQEFAWARLPNIEKLF